MPCLKVFFLSYVVLILPFVYFMRQIGGEVGFIMFLLTAALKNVVMNCLTGLTLKF